MKAQRVTIYIAKTEGDRQEKREDIANILVIRGADIE